MKQIFKPRRLVILLAGVLFLIYAAYNVFIIFRDRKEMPLEGIIISAIVAFLFAVLSAFAFSSLVNSTDIRFLMARSTTFIITMLIIIGLKVRIVGKIINYINFSELHTVIFGVSYFLTLLGMMVLFFHYSFILKGLPLFPRASVIFPLAAIILFALSMGLEAVLFFVYHIDLEANTIRTIIIRPVFYLGFIALSAYFLFPPEIADNASEND